MSGHNRYRLLKKVINFLFGHRQLVTISVKLEWIRNKNGWYNNPNISFHREFTLWLKFYVIQKILISKVYARSYFRPFLIPIYIQIAQGISPLFANFVRIHTKTWRICCVMIGLNHQFNVKCMLLLHQVFCVSPLSVVMAWSIISGITFVIFTEASLVAWQWLCGLLIPWWRHQMAIFSALLAILRGIHRSPVNSPHKGQWRGALIFSLICA